MKSSFPVILIGLLLMAMAPQDIPKEIPLWLKGAPGSEGKTAPEKIVTSESGDLSVSTVSGVGHGFGLRPNMKGAAAQWPNELYTWMQDRGFIKNQ